MTQSHIAADTTLIIRDAAKAIATSRDFCGNEREACLDSFAENGITPTAALIDAAFSLAESMWDEYRREAKVAARY